MPPSAGPKPPPRAPSEPDDAAQPASFRWPDPGNRHLAAAPGIGDQQLGRLARGEPEAEERIDLHGTRVAEAKRLLARRIASARARGLRCVLVVHGRGRGSATNDAPLRDAVPDWLTRGETGRSVLAFAPAPRQQGGEGATMVLLRKSGSPA
ncbi:MAG: Smr/MutS family protein [Deltaproteobacteria bacterium]|nr:Smr/MutS family protein [Deltaproteobacteria bacterium]